MKENANSCTPKIPLYFSDMQQWTLWNFGFQHKQENKHTETKRNLEMNLIQFFAKASIIKVYQVKIKILKVFCNHQLKLMNFNSQEVKDKNNKCDEVCEQD